VRRFRFRLQPALDQAVRREESAKAALATALADCAREEHALRSVVTQAAGLRPSRDAGLHLEVLAGMRAARERRVANMRAEIARLRHELGETMRKRQALEMLRDKRRAEFELELERAEMRELDDLNAMRRHPL
jgi:flagellar export protein FliJ